MGWEGGGVRIQKPIKKCHEINIISALTQPNNSLKKAMKLGVFLLSSLTLWLNCPKETQGLGEGHSPQYGVCFLLAQGR